MRTRFFGLMILMVLLAGLLPATPAFADDDDGNYEFKGTIESLPGPAPWYGTWVVGGRNVDVDATTRIEQEHGAVAAGVCVEVKGWLQSDGSVDATKIKTEESYKCSGGGGGDDDGHTKFYGTIESLPSTAGWVGEWTVSGRTVHVSAFTRIEQEHGPVAVGAYVEVEGNQRTDGSMDATKIEVKSSSGGGGGSGGYVKFYGTIESLPAGGLIGTWVVSGRTVYVSAATQIKQEHGAVAEGAYVEVKGTQTNGEVDATEIEVKMGAGSGGGGGGGSYTKFYGTVQALPSSGLIGDWTVNGRTVHVSAATRIEQEHGFASVNAYVEVKGWQRTDDSVDATEIEVKRGAGSGGGGSYTKFYGTIESLPAGGLIGDWTVNGRTVHVGTFTRIDQEHGAAVVNAYVEVKGYRQTDNSVNAAEIEVKASPGGSGGGSHIKFYGTVEQLPATGVVGTWIISGRVTTVTATTRIEQEHGQAAVGAYVEVEGNLQPDGSVAATKIEVKRGASSGGGGGGYIKFYGLIEDLPASRLAGDWMVGGRLVHVDASTRIEQEHGAVQIGAFVEVKGIQQSDGSVNASKIEVKN